MYTLSCKDLGQSDCDFVAKGKSEAEVIQKMMSHMRPNHADAMGDMSDDELHAKLASQVKAETVKVPA